MARWTQPSWQLAFGACLLSRLPNRNPPGDWPSIVTNLSGAMTRAHVSEFFFQAPQRTMRVQIHGRNAPMTTVSSVRFERGDLVKRGKTWVSLSGHIDVVQVR
jgi:hypothetical protein